MAAQRRAKRSGWRLCVGSARSLCCLHTASLGKAKPPFVSWCLTSIEALVGLAGATVGYLPFLFMMVIVMVLGFSVCVVAVTSGPLFLSLPRDLRATLKETVS